MHVGVLAPHSHPPASFRPIFEVRPPPSPTHSFHLPPTPIYLYTTCTDAVDFYVRAVTSLLVEWTTAMFTRSTIRWAAGAGHAFMDIAIGSQPPHRVTFELFTKKCPIASENFLKLCTGENVLPQVSSIDGIGEPSFRDQFLPQLTYRNTTVHRVCKGYLVQGGDIVSGQGTGQLSIYGEFFDAPEEVKASKFDRMGLLGTAVSAPHLNGSQFFILTADKAPHLNGTCICFGRVVDGWAVVKAIEAIPLTAAGEPTERVVVVECGKL
ncbi:cyclophilin 10, putative [Leishmania donovani]|uniref:Peptidyl-prolyl cis-trans isomerase n=1 Tax=Leishmania donovani TaxID=5661 RepID=A0A3S7XB52_LEIDO|nr:cyclophilin 10, putative [Leishmania donovani]